MLAWLRERLGGRRDGPRAAVAGFEEPPRRASGFFSAEAEAFFAHYATMQAAAGTIVPGRAALVPAQIKRLLPWIAIGEHPGPQQCIGRLIGTGIVQRIGFDPTGMNYFAFIEEGQRPGRQASFEVIFGFPCAAHALHLERYGAGGFALTEIVCVPLAPAHPGGPPLNATISIDLPAGVETGPRASFEGISLILYQAYLDIGAGLPPGKPPVG